MMRAAALGLVAVAACSDPSIAIDLQYADGALADRSASLTVSVIDAVSAGAALAPGHVATCDDVGFGLIAPEILEGARRASVAADAAARISGVPRLGPKLVIAEAKSAAGRRVGAGCTALGDIEDDVAVAITVEVAPRVQELGRAMTGTAPAPVTFIATATWDEAVPVAGRDVLVELYASGGLLDEARLTTLPTGLAITPALDDRAVPGPLQTIVRVRWADQPLRVASYNEWARVPTATGMPVRISSTARMPPAWITGTVDGPSGMSWMALTLHSRLADDADELVAVFLDAGARLDQRAIAAPGARAITVWGGKVWTVLNDGWYQFSITAMPATPTVPEAGGRASDLVTMITCAGTQAGILVRRTAGGYQAYLAPGTVAPAGSTLALLAAEIGADRIINQVCATGPDGLERVVIVETGSVLRAVRVSDGAIDSRDFPLPLMSTVTEFGSGTKRGLAGAMATQTGPRAVSFRFTTYTIGAGEIDVAVASNAVDVPIASLPQSLAVADLDGDPVPDVIALLPSGAGLRIQVVTGLEVAGLPLMATTAVFPTSRGAVDGARMVLEQVDRDGEACLELVVLTGDGVEVVRPELEDAAGARHCPRP